MRRTTEIDEPVVGTIGEERGTFVQRLAQRRGLRQFVKFGIVGSSGLIVNLFVFTVLQHFTPQWEQRAAYNAEFSAAFLAGGVSNYFLNRWWTFRSSGHQGKEALSFLTVSVIALVTGLVVSNALQPVLGHGHRSWFAGTCAGILVNFFVNKYWTFRNVR